MKGAPDANPIRRQDSCGERRWAWVRQCIAETFAGLGACVFGCDLSAAELAETAKAGVKTEVLDLTDRAAAAAWIMEIGQTTDGAIDVLVNNAGGVAGQEMRTIEEVPDAD
jgi:3-oxoacyl-[acyl-carrier protein] reductase